MNEYRGKHAPSRPWPVASSASVPARRGRHQKKNRRRRIGLLILFALILLMIAYPFIEPKIYTVDRFEIKSDRIRSEEKTRPLRIVYVSDIHWGYWMSDWDLSRLVDQINGLYPDIIIFGGDYATDHESAIRFFSALQRYKLRPRLKAYGVLGETDYIGESVDMNSLRDAMSNANVQLLVNETALYNTDVGKVCIAGLDDITYGSPNLRKLSSSEDVSISDYVILAGHNPAIIPSAQLQKNNSNSYEWFDLGLFGHTHGGQIPVLSSWLDFADEVPDRYREGWLYENRSWLLISRGIGTSSVPCRLFCYPQIHCIDIIPE